MLINLDRYIMSIFININMNVKNARMIYIVKRRSSCQFPINFL